LKLDLEKREKELKVLSEERETVHQVNLELMDEHETLITKYEQLKSQNTKLIKQNEELTKSNDVF